MFPGKEFLERFGKNRNGKNRNDKSLNDNIGRFGPDHTFETVSKTVYVDTGWRNDNFDEGTARVKDKKCTLLSPTNLMHHNKQGSVVLILTSGFYEQRERSRLG
jgi:hypothetical protein